MSSSANSHHVYTDGSLKMGVAASVYSNSNATVYFFATVLGTSSSVYRAELVAIRKALEHNVANLNTTIFCDNRAAILTIGSKPNSDCDIAAIQQMAHQRNITIIWVPGHVDIHGNERADALAQHATNHAMREAASHTEAATIKRLIHRRSLEVWNLAWKSSPNGAGLKEINGLTIGSTTKLYAGLHRGHASILAQACTGHLSINDFLRSHRVPGKTGECDMCGLRGNCQHLLFCKGLASVRNRLEKHLKTIGFLRVGSRIISFKRLLNEAKAAEKSAEFLLERFPTYWLNYLGRR